MLPNDLKTEIVSTFDFTAWRHVFSLRTSPMAHPQMRQLAVPLLADFKKRWPAVFDDITILGVDT
jgi:thymidylate synthase (FAD)